MPRSEYQMSTFWLSSRSFKLLALPPLLSLRKLRSPKVPSSLNNKQVEPDCMIMACISLIIFSPITLGLTSPEV